MLLCKDSQGRDCYFFILTLPEHIKALKAAPDFDLNDYGKIIASGFGKEPSRAVVEMLKEKYDIDADNFV